MKLVLYTQDEKLANLKLAQLHAEGKKAIIKYDKGCKQYKVYQTNKLEPDECRLPQWAQKRLNELRAIPDNSLEFKPDKRFLKEHEEHPILCPMIKCYCLCNDWTEEYGFCVGLQPDSKDSPDIVSFCCSYYDPTTQKPAAHQFLWHPQEANWIAAILSLATTESWGLMPKYRNLLRQLENKKRGIGSHANNRDKQRI